MPSEWLPVIWGAAEPEFDSMEQAQRILNAIMGRYNEILHLLRHAPEAFEPIFWTTEHGEVASADWAEGFMEAVELRPGAWEPLLDSEEDRQLLAPIVAHLHDEDGDPIIDGDLGDIGQLRREATELIGPSVPMWIGPEIQAVLRRQLGWPMAFGSKIISRKLNLFCGRHSRVDC